MVVVKGGGRGDGGGCGCCKMDTVFFCLQRKL